MKQIITTKLGKYLRDGTEVRTAEETYNFWGTPEVGRRMVLFKPAKDGESQMRTTTPVVSIEDVDSLPL